MPHTRARFLAPLNQKSLKFWPIVCLVGARQVGKSTFLKQLRDYTYLTLDDPGLNELALKNPKTLLKSPCIIDEAQKVPALFDAVKMDVDQKRIPGKYILTGSVRFSNRTLIRESLTGRAKVIQLFPFMCAEALELPFEYRWDSQAQERKIRVKRTELQKTLSKGGMPGIFAARNSSETFSYWKTLIDSYVYRDLLFAVPKNPKPALALKILKAVAEILALSETPTFSRILKKTGGSRVQVERHLLGLEDLMILQRLPHLDASPTKDMFLLFDSALFLTLLELNTAQHDAAVHLSCLQIRMVQEMLASQQITDFQQPVYYAESTQGQKIHIITKDKKGLYSFFQIYEEPVPHDYDLRFLKAQAKKWRGTATGLTSLERAQVLPDVLLLPWEQVL